MFHHTTVERSARALSGSILHLDGLGKRHAHGAYVAHARIGDDTQNRFHRLPPPSTEGVPLPLVGLGFAKVIPFDFGLDGVARRRS